MPKGHQKGAPKIGGRKAGTPNKDKSAGERLAELGCDPIEGMATIAQNKLPCGVCRGEGKTRYLMPVALQKKCQCISNRPAAWIEEKGKPSTRMPFDIPAVADCVWCSGTGVQNIGVRTCQSCYGTLWEACSPDLRGKMFQELAKYTHAQKKAVELSGAVELSELTQRLVAGRERMRKVGNCD